MGTTRLVTVARSKTGSFMAWPAMVTAVALAAALSGCASVEEAASKLGIKVEKKPIDSSSGSTAQASTANAPGAAAQGIPNPIRGTELDGIFKKNEISNTKRPETFPRVALTIKAGTEGVFKLSGPSTLLPTDCVTFDVRLWTNAQTSKKFENLRMCTGAVAEASKGVAFRTLNLFPRFTQHAGVDTTAARRTDGPNSPFYMFPQDIQSQHAWVVTNQNTIFFLGAILLSLGYDWDNDFDRRLWVVSVPLDAKGTVVTK